MSECWILRLLAVVVVSDEEKNQDCLAYRIVFPSSSNPGC